MVAVLTCLATPTRIGAGLEDGPVSVLEPKGGPPFGLSKRTLQKFLASSIVKQHYSFLQVFCHSCHRS